MPVDPHRRPIMVVVFMLLRQLIVQAADKLTQVAFNPTVVAALRCMAEALNRMAVVANPMAAAVNRTVVVARRVVEAVNRVVVAGITTKHPATDQIPGSGAYQLRCFLL